MLKPGPFPELNALGSFQDNVIANFQLVSSMVKENQLSKALDCWGSACLPGGYRPAGVPETANVDVSFNLRERVRGSERKEKSRVWRAGLGYVQAAILFLQYVPLYTFLKLTLLCQINILKLQ